MLIETIESQGQVTPEQQGPVPDSVEAAWRTSGETYVHTVPSNIAGISNGFEQERASHNVFSKIHVIMNGHVGDHEATPMNKTKIIQMFAQGIPEDPQEPLFQNLEKWYKSLAEEPSNFLSGTWDEALDSYLTRLSSSGRGGAQFLGFLKESAAADSKNMRGRLAVFAAVNALGLYEQSELFIQMMQNSSEKNSQRYHEIAEIADGERSNFLERITAAGLGEYIDMDRASAFISKVDVRVEDFATGVIYGYSIKEPRINGEANPKTGVIRILEQPGRKSPDNRTLVASINHEFVHMISDKKVLDKDISLGFQHPEAGGDFRGTIFNEGMTESVTQSLLGEESAVYSSEVETLNVIFGSDEGLWDKALRVFFNGDQSAESGIPIIDLVDSVLGTGAAREIDALYQKEGAIAALEYAKQLKQANPTG